MTKKNLILTSLSLLLLDQLSKKIIFTQNLPHQKNTSLFLFNIQPTLLIILSLILLTTLFLWLVKTTKKTDKRLTLALSLIFTGGLSNFLDRSISGYVIDWLFLPFFPFSVFNLADVYITLGTFLVFIPSKKQPSTTLLQ
jgi:lipoprotein signal peptidase